MLALYGGHEQIARALLFAAQRAEVNQIVGKDHLTTGALDGQGGNTPLHIACAKGLVDFVKAVVKAGAELEARDAAGSTPLLNACRDVIF